MQFDRDRTFDVIHSLIDLDVDMEKKSLQGRNKITLSPLNNNFKTVKVDSVSLVVTEAKDSREKNWRWFAKQNASRKINFCVDALM